MTREEALKTWLPMISMSVDDMPEIKEALEMAVKALEQDPCDDCISRQAVLEYIEGSEAELGHSSENELVCQDIKELPSVAIKPCDDCISRQAVLNIIEREEFKGDAISEIEKLSPVTPQPKMGRWIIVDDCEKFIAKCSECGRIEDSRMISKYNYCHCGAKMQEVEENGQISNI